MGVKGSPAHGVKKRWGPKTNIWGFWTGNREAYKDDWNLVDSEGKAGEKYI